MSVVRYENEAHLMSLRDLIGDMHRFRNNTKKYLVVKRVTKAPNTTLNVVRGDHGIDVSSFKLRCVHSRI